ncbi:YolD-like family protein [Halobacillus litoralis]|uniref:YolD-like family protein n=1 Tax=Halobacillus litoralis TaxID=45668 RepID=A0A845EEW9_9BACI|nr:YolD-like family protein [Halobacillus litoralis]MYL50241.1 YolD-like family protein [Halobacillus litoralis]
MDNRNRDRGTIKWTSLMLPEHVEMVKKVWEEDKRIQRPILDEQQKDEISFILQRALHDSLPIEIKIYNGFDFSTYKVKTNGLDYINGKVQCVKVNFNEKLNLNIEDVVEVRVI